MDGLSYDPNNHFIAPDFKRRQLLFDSFAKLQAKSTTSDTPAANQQNANATSNNAAAAAAATGKAAAQPNNASSMALANSTFTGTSTLLTNDGAKGTLLYSWGAGYHGQLGLNTARKKCRLAPSCIALNEPIQQVACGGFHTAVLTDDGRVYAWGDGRVGQLGNLQRKHNMHSTPRIVDYLVSYKVTVAHIACGQYHTAAVSTNGRLFTWGSGKWGQLGHGVRQDERFPRKVDTDKAAGNFVKVACGDRHTVVLNDVGQIVTFGNGQHGQLGHGNGLDQLRPMLLQSPVLAGQRIVQVDCGATTTAVVTSNGSLFLWGFGESLHPKSVPNVLESPRLVEMKEVVKQVACGLGHVLVLTEGGDVYSFGVATMGQLGHGSKSSVRTPRLILRGKEIDQVCCGRYHSMAVTAYGVVYSWGCGESGQLGNGTLENEVLPNIVSELLPNVVGHISCGEHHSLALTSISHAAVSADVAHWKVIEDAEYKLKVSMIKDAPNGLKSKHILSVESERETIIGQLADTMKKEREDKNRAAAEKMRLIATNEQIARTVANAHSRYRTNNDDGDAMTVDSLQLAANRLMLTDGNIEHSGGNSPMRSPNRSLQQSPREDKAFGEEKEGDDARPITQHRRAISNASAANDLTVNAFGEALRPSTNSNTLKTIHDNESDSTALIKSSVNSSANITAVGFAPLAPRIAFIEQTSKTLARVRSFMTQTVIPNESNYVEDLLTTKKNFNALKSERQRLTAIFKEIKHELALCQPNSEEETASIAASDAVKQLNMKLVTLNTRLMEAEENKKNYELYIIRMKEEDLQLGKQIDHLRSICAEYDRLLAKLTKMNRRVLHQRVEVVEETAHFVDDVTEFIKFADNVVKDYRRVLNASYKQSLYQEQLLEQRQSRQEEKRLVKISALRDELNQIVAHQSDSRKEIDGWETKVDYYEKRFRMVAAATGLTRAESIISKFYFNDEITRDLQNEIEFKEAAVVGLKEKKETLITSLLAAKQSVSVRKWKDVTALENTNGEAKLKFARAADEHRKWTERVTSLMEGIKLIASKAASATNEPSAVGESSIERDSAICARASTASTESAEAIRRIQIALTENIRIIANANSQSAK